MAAAKEEMFDDVVLSNCTSLVRQIFLWSDELQKLCKEGERSKGSISKQLRRFSKRSFNDEVYVSKQ